MRCQDVQNQLQALSLGELPRDVRQSVQDHLAGCAACQAELARIDTLAAVLAATQAPPIPAGFASRVLAMAVQRQEAETVETWNLVRWWRLAPPLMHAAAAAVMVLGLAVGIAMGSAFLPLTALAAENVQPGPVDAYQLDYLDEAPGGSLADSYLTLVATTTEGGR